jgi:hypothetical protein
MTGSRAIAVFLSFLCVASCRISAQGDGSYSPPPFPAVVFFPPSTPVYGAAIEERHSTGARIVNGRRLLVPDGMADFAGEHFYPQLSTRLILGVLSRELEARLHAYRTQRSQQVTELLNQFVILHDQPAEAWESHLREFARTQSSQLVALENEADRLSEMLVADGLRNRIDWNADRRWKLGAIKGGTDGAVEAEAEFQVMRAAAHYQAGLLTQQRGLLREVAMELQLLARKARGLPGTRADSDAMFFSPETTRFRMPADSSTELREKIGLYNSRKSTLKRELRELVVAQEGVGGAARKKAFEALADNQWPELLALEELADEIRRLLAPRTQVSAPPAPPWIPAGVMDAIRTYNEDRDTYFGELRHRMEAAAARVPPTAYVSSLDERIQAQREYVKVQNEARRQAANEFQQQNAERYAGLEKRYKMIREALSVVAEKQVDRKTGRPLDADTLLRQYGASMEEFNTFGRESAIYTNYRTAMLQPGLSPEQRRLLLSYAIVGLAQPLPHGELLPRRNATRPSPSW